MDALIGLAVIVATIAATVAIVAVVVATAFALLNSALGQLDRAARNRQFPIQFGLADLLCLFVLIQLPIGFVHWALGDILRQAVVGVDVLLGVVVTAVWWKCVRTLSRAGIHVVWQRCFVLAISLPGSFVSSVGLIVLPLFAVYSLVTQQYAAAEWLLIVEVILPFILFALGRFTNAIVAFSTKGVAPENSRENSREPTAPGEQQ